MVPEVCKVVSKVNLRICCCSNIFLWVPANAFDLESCQQTSKCKFAVVQTCFRVRTSEWPCHWMFFPSLTGSKVQFCQWTWGQNDLTESCICACSSQQNSCRYITLHENSKQAMSQTSGTTRVALTGLKGPPLTVPPQCCPKSPWCVWPCSCRHQCGLHCP